MREQENASQGLSSAQAKSGYSNMGKPPGELKENQRGKDFASQFKDF
ncbi:MAG: hypothetical protein ACLRVT_05200 [Oscillospiraceae bacterium]